MGSMGSELVPVQVLEAMLMLVMLNPFHGDARLGVCHRAWRWLHPRSCDYRAKQHEAQTGEEGKDDIHGREERWDKVHAGPVLRRI